MTGVVLLTVVFGWVGIDLYWIVENSMSIHVMTVSAYGDFRIDPFAFLFAISSYISGVDLQPLAAFWKGLVWHSPAFVGFGIDD